MTTLGPIVPKVCGFSPTRSADICGEPPLLHAWFISDGNNDFGFACQRHAPILASLADQTHPSEIECFDDDAWWLTRPDGSSFCFHPETDAALHAELAAGTDARPLAPLAAT